MSRDRSTFAPLRPLIDGSAHNDCQACVIVPAHNEEALLGRCLAALAAQVDLEGKPLPSICYEVILLLNNCTDGSAQVATAFAEQHPQLVLHCVERTLPPPEAHVGMARRWLMDTAWGRLCSRTQALRAILSTDADTVAAPDWVAQNLGALQAGADLVGGAIHVAPEELSHLPAEVQRCYERDRRYAALIAALEDALDPQPADSCPRHLDHFGSSLGCTPEAYAALGGMPALRALEDEAFVDRARHANLRVRHEPAVRVFTSARLCGRTEVGLAGQLRLWQDLAGEGAHRVRSAAYLEYRFRMLRKLREVYCSKQTGDLALPTEWWENTFREALAKQTTCPGFLGAVYCDILIRESFEAAHGSMEEPILDAIAGLQARLEAARKQPSEIAP